MTNTLESKDPVKINSLLADEFLGLDSQNSNLQQSKKQKELRMQLQNDEEESPQQ